MVSRYLPPDMNSDHFPTSLSIRLVSQLPGVKRLMVTSNRYPGLADTIHINTATADLNRVNCVFWQKLRPTARVDDWPLKS
jgi:hypothetical protein